MPYLPTYEHNTCLHFLKSSFTSFDSFMIFPPKALYISFRFSHRYFMVSDVTMNITFYSITAPHQLLLV